MARKQADINRDELGELKARLAEAQAVQSALYKINEVAAETDTMEEFYSSLHQIIGELMYAENLFIALYDSTKERLRFVYMVDSVDVDVNTEILKTYPVETLNKTITGYVLRSGKMLHEDTEGLDILAQQGHINHVGAECIDWLGMPLKYKTEVMGALVVQSYEPSVRYEAKDEEILRFVSRQIALVLMRMQSENALQLANTELEASVDRRTAQLRRINEDLERQIIERRRAEKLQSALFRITELTNTTHDLSEFYAQLHTIVSDLIYAKNLFVAIVDEKENTLNFPYYSDEYEEHPISRPLQAHSEFSGLSEQVIHSGRALMWEHKNNEVFPGRGKTPESWVGVPLRDQAKTFGVLGVQSYEKDQRFAGKDKILLTYVGRHIATALLRRQDAESLDHAHLELKSINDELEKRVTNRTEELEATNRILLKNIDQRMQVEKKLEHDALHDTLTNLPNRALFMDRLNHALHRIERKNEQPFALFFLDLDRFKYINDSLGHHIGDRLLQETSQRLDSCIRGGDTVARMGGDEFCILLDGIENDEYALRIAKRILQAIARLFELDGQEIKSSTSLGIRFVNEPGESADQILRDADAAMYQAKSEHYGQYCIFDESLSRQERNRIQVERDLRNAIGTDQFIFHYQPIIDLENGTVHAVEALLRWNHPQLGLIAPNHFIPIAEETGMIVDIGAQALEMACNTLSHWHNHAALCQLSLTVNLSPKQIAQGDLMPFIAKLLELPGVDGHRLNIEITENVLVHSFETAKQLILGLRAHGIKTYLDDFGTGYSSLNYLHNFPFDVLKLDRTFVSDLSITEANTAIVRAVLLLAKSLNMSAVAEGIETIEQLKTLSEMGYHYGQGFLFSKPLPIAEVESFVNKFDLGAFMADE